MNKTDFEILLQKIEPIISKQDTKFRNATSASLRLAVTLRYLATGNSYTSLSYTFEISRQLISKIVPEVCRTMIQSLKDYIRIPSNKEEWKEVARKFNMLWNFPHCVGAIDGKHVLVIAPPNSGMRSRALYTPPGTYYREDSEFNVINGTWRNEIIYIL